MMTAHCTRPEMDCDTDHPRRAKTRPSALSLVLLAPRLLAASLSGAAEVLRKTLDGGFTDACPHCHHHHDPHHACCDIPETVCPSPYVCHVRWVGCPGDTLHYQIQVTNIAKIKREFTLTPVPFPFANEVITLSVDKKTLLPDQSLQSMASFTIPETFAGSTYHTRIKIAGAYEQFILVTLTVHPKQCCRCHIEQGDIPKHIKAHQWFHHFQCEEDCFEPVKKGA